MNSYRTSHLRKDSIRTYARLGLTYAKLGDYDQGISFIDQAVAVGVRSDNLRDTYTALYSKAHYYTLTQEFEKRVSLLPSLLQLSKELEDSTLIVRSLNILVQSAEINAQYDSAEYYLKQAIRYDSDTSALTRADYQISMASLQERVGRDLEAKNNALAAIAVFQKYGRGETEAVNFAYELLGDIEFKNKRFAAAAAYFQRALDNAVSSGNLTRQKDYLERVIEVQRALENFPLVLNLLEQQQEIKDSLAKNFYEEQLADAAVRMEVVQKEKRLLRQKERIDRQVRQKRVYAIIILLLGLFLMAMLIAYGYIRRDKRKIAAQKIALEQSLQDKEVLLREVHHRVKNNLQIISSLFDKQARHAEHPDFKKLMLEGKSRLQSIALIHQKLYRDTNVRSVDFSTYLQQLVDYITHSHAPIGVTTEVIATDIILDLDRAVPLGLIVHELLINALKHAFITKENGNVKIRFAADLKNDFLLKIEDDGIGLPPDWDTTEESNQGLGLHLIRGLVE